MRNRFCVVFVPKSDKHTGRSKHPIYLFRGPMPPPDELLDKCTDNLQTEISVSKGQIIFGKEKEINLTERKFDGTVHCVDWNGSSSPESLGDFIKGHADKYLAAQPALG